MLCLFASLGHKQVATRLIHFREGGHLVPFLDMANHKNGCKHNIGVRPCDELTPSASKSNGNNAQPSTGLLNTTRVCVYWKAGADLNAGEEVCLPYGYMLPDRAMLQYGFLPAELSTSAAAADLKVPLFGMDRHDFKQLSAEGLPWGFWNDNDTSPEPFSGERGGAFPPTHEVCTCKQILLHMPFLHTMVSGASL